MLTCWLTHILNYDKHIHGNVYCNLTEGIMKWQLPGGVWQWEGWGWSMVRKRRDIQTDIRHVVNWLSWRRYILARRTLKGVQSIFSCIWLQSSEHFCHFHFTCNFCTGTWCKHDTLDWHENPSWFNWTVIPVCFRGNRNIHTHSLHPLTWEFFINKVKLTVTHLSLHLTGVF